MPIDPGDAARNKLLTLEQRRQLAVVSEFEKIQKRLTAEIADLLERIEKQRRIDGNASPNLLLQKARLSELLDAITKEINDSAAKLAGLTTSAQNQAVDVAKTQASQYPDLKADISFFDGPAARELIGIAGDGSPLAVHFAKLAAPARQAMFDALFFGISAGVPNGQIAREVKQALGGTTAQAMAIVRTETNRAYREASRKFYDAAPDVIGWRWLAAINATPPPCPICWSQHGRVFKTKTKLGSHVNCRCSMVPVFAGDAAVETGPELFAKLNEAQQKNILGPRRLELYKQGAKLSDFVETNKSAFGIGRRIKPLDRTTFKPKARTLNPTNPEPFRPTTPKPALPAAADVTAIRPGDPVPLFANARQATDYMSQRFPGTAFDYSGMHIELVRTNTAEMARLMDLYPETAARVKSVVNENRAGFGPAIAKHFGTSTTSRIAYNGRLYSDAEKFRAKKKYGLDIGWSASDKDYSTTTHEFGHAVDYWIDSLGAKSIFRPAFADGRAEITSIADRIVRELKPKYGELSDYAIQGRGLRQRREQFAEGFSMMHNRPAKDWPAFVRAQKLFIDRLQNSKIYDLNEQTEFRNLSDDEKAAARAEFDDFIKSLGLKVKR